jgi:succinoglycan biosynthesis transport protein ExoP
MNPAPQPPVSPSQLVSVLWRYPARWLAPMLVLGVLATAYALLRPATWEASQALIVRNEASTGGDRPGKFYHSDEMRTVQETILELAKCRDVLAAALREVGPPADHKSRGVWPTARDVAKLYKSVKLSPPKGAEFGTTEVFYLKVEAHDRGRAIELATVIAEGLKSRHQKLLDDRAASMIRELERTVALAETDLEASTEQLAKLERSVGSELAELRILDGSPSGNSDLRQKVVAVDFECREAREDRRAKAELLSLLESCQNDPERLLALPDRLLDSHATLRKLIEGLTAARLKTCTLLGKMSEEHPLVRAAWVEEREIVGKIETECESAVEIAETELRLSEALVTSLEAQLTDLQTRFEGLSGQRAQYANSVAKTHSHTVLVETARGSLADARASQAAARASSLIDAIGTADTGIYPVGPSRSMIVLAGLAGGLLAGLGVMFLTVDLTPEAAAELDEPALVTPSLKTPRKKNGSGEPEPVSFPVSDSLSLPQVLARVCS